MCVHIIHIEVIAVNTFNLTTRVKLKERSQLSILRTVSYRLNMSGKSLINNFSWNFYLLSYCKFSFTIFYSSHFMPIESFKESIQQAGNMTWLFELFANSVCGLYHWTIAAIMPFDSFNMTVWLSFLNLIVEVYIFI